MTSVPQPLQILRGCKLILCLWMTGVLLISCASTTSKSKFMTMSLPERQETVCYESDSFLARKTQLDSYQAQILEKQEALNQGYRVHRYCQSVTVPLPLRDCSDKEGAAKGWCEGQPKSKRETRCTENPVSIDPEYEEASRDKYQAAYTKLNSQHLTQTQSCLTKVAQISTEEAYVYYSQRMEPQSMDAAGNKRGTSGVSKVPAENAGDSEIVGTYRLEYTDYANRASVFRAFPEGLGRLKWVENDGVYQFYYRSGNDTELLYAFTINPTDGSLLTFRSDQVRPKWNATARKISTSPDAEFDLFELGQSQGDSQYRCFNVGHAERPYATQPLSNAVTTTADTLAACEALCPSLVAWRESQGYPSSLSDCP